MLNTPDGYFHELPFDGSWYTVTNGRVDFTFTKGQPNLTLADFLDAHKGRRFTKPMNRDAMRATVERYKAMVGA